MPYEQVRPLFIKHCLSCHDAKQAEGKLVMETYALLMKGGEDGPAIIPGKPDQSPLIQQVEHTEKPFMPPPKKAKPLAPEEIALLRNWIQQGAHGPAAGEEDVVAQALPHVNPTTAPRRAINAIAYDPKSRLLALAVLNEVELRSLDNQAVISKLGPHTGHVNALAFTADGAKLIAASGAPGVAGEITIWNTADGKLLKRFAGHKDAIYGLAITADGKTIATGSYDQKIILWDTASAAPLRTLSGHNGAVVDVAFRPDGNVLASASADRTVKLWDVATGNRLDTRSEPTKEQQTLLFSPDGSKLYAAGADNRVRVWKISPTAIEGSNTLLFSQFAAEGSILRLALSKDGNVLATTADDKTVKLWDAQKLELIRALEPQSDWPAAVAFALDSKILAVGRIDGTIGFYDPAAGKPIPPPKPELTNIEPRGLQCGHSVKVKLTGKDILAATTLKITGNDKLTATLLPAPRGTSNVALARIDAALDAPLGAFDVIAVGPGGASAPAKFIVDDLPQIEEIEKPLAPASAQPATRPLATTLPVTFGGTFASRGDVDSFAFDAKAGQTIVIDVAARRFASKADPVVTLFDPAGHPIGMASDDDTDPDPLLVRTLTDDGRYEIRVNDLLGATSPQHYYRVSVGTFAYVTGCFPLAVAPGGDAAVNLIGYNLPHDARIKVKAPETGEIALPLDRSLYRTRRAINVMVGGPAEATEVEPNDLPAQASKLSLGSGVSGTFDSKPGGDIDLYRFDAKAGQFIVVETQAAQRGSPADTRVEVRWPSGKPVERVQLQAVRDSWITFRPIDASVVGARLNSWEEMELNQYLYMQGEVVKLYLYPRGPDSEFNFYAMGGRRRSYFDTSPIAHALEEKCYIVQPRKPGEALPQNGLPVFKLNYVNDDDSLRQLGADSRLLFTAPADGSYLVRVTDTRNFGGPRLTYRLVVRDAHPDFTAHIEGLNPTLPAGSGRSFVVRVNRIDGFDAPVTVDLSGATPPFLISSPIVVQAGQVEAQGTIFAALDPATTKPIQSGPIKVTSRATIEGKELIKPLPDLPKFTIAGQPLLTVTLAPIDPKERAIVVQPGQRVPAMLQVKRGTYKGLVSFEVENLPHGVIVADIGLSGVLIPDGQNERQIFLQCAPWVTQQTRICHARALQGDNPTSPPVLLQVAETLKAVSKTASQLP